MSLLVGSFWGDSEFTGAEWGDLRVVTGKMRLSWSPADCPDADYYTVKFSPDTETPWEEAAEVFRSTSFLLFQTEEHECVIDDRYGLYMVRCTDTSGNLGEEATLIHDQNLLEWKLFKSYVSEPEWRGSVKYMSRTSDGKLQINPDAPLSNGRQTGFHQISNWVNADANNGLPEPLRIVSNRLVTYGDGVTAVHQWRNFETGVNDWRDFDDDEIMVLGRVDFQIVVENPNPEIVGGLSSSEILVYIPDRG